MRPIAALDRVVSLDPNNIQAFNNRGMVYMKQRNLLAAIADFRKTIQIDPNFAEGYYNQAIAYFRRASPNEAKENFTKAAALFKVQGKTQQYQETLRKMKGVYR